ncbi:hypothetical protein AB1Y20_019377 [Prymnesium parvum]|uniref:Uncharacterized protein n=1 Tax=Prymnesium parvum TaxID=97485 RepID=A0AB34JUB5_PRYPA
MLKFVAKAKELSHPAHEADLALPRDLVDAVRFVVHKREGIVAWREARLQHLLRDCADGAELESVREHKCLSESIKFSVQG